MNIKKMFVFLFILLIGVSVVAASDINSSDAVDTQEDVITATSQVDNSNIEENTMNNDKNSNLKRDSKTVVINSTSFDDYVTDGKFNDNVNEGDTVDFQGLLDNTRFGLTVNKPVNIISSTNDAYIGADTPMGFTINSGGSGTNISGIYFNNVHFVLQHAHDVHINNISVVTSGQLVGSGQGVTSIREDSVNITVNNSYFKSVDNTGVSTLVCAVAQDVLIENCTIEAAGFVGNLVYFTTYNVDYDHSRGYGNRNITFRNNYINANNARQQSICYGLTMEGIGHTIENNIIEYGYYCIQQQANVDNNDEVSQIIIRNNTIPYGTNNIAYALVENNTFNDIEHLKYCNFTNNVANNINCTGSGTLINNTIASLELKADDVNLLNNTFTNGVLFTNGKSYTIIGSEDVNAISSVVTIGYNSYTNYSSVIDGTLYVNENIPDNSYVIINATMYQFRYTNVNINSTVNNVIIKFNQSNNELINIEGTNITIVDTNLPSTDIESTTQTKLINSVFFSTDNINNFILENSTIYTANNDVIIFDSDDYDNLFDADTNTLLDSVNDNSILLIRNMSTGGDVNNYDKPIIINKPVSITSLDKSVFDADITFIGGSENSNISNINSTQSIIINAGDIRLENNTLNNVILNNSDNNRILSNKFTSTNTAIILENSKYNNITNNSIKTDGTYTIKLDDTSINNNIISNKLQSLGDYTNYTINADFTSNTIEDNAPAPYPTTVSLEVPSSVVLNTPTTVVINVSYYRDLVDNGHVVILVNGMQKDNITLTDGQATTDITFTEDGTNTVKVWYFADKYYATNTSSKNVTASKISTNLEFTQISSVKVGENATVTVKVTDGNNQNIEEGNITLTIKNDTYIAQIHDGLATTTITTKAEYMSQILTATYNGTPTRKEKSITSALSLQKGDSLIMLYDKQITDDKITVTLLITDINGVRINGGKVKISGNDITASTYLDLVNGTVSYDITPVPSDDFVITVNFRSNTAFNNNEQELTVTLDAMPPRNVTITLTADNTKIGESTTFTATLTDQYGDSVTGENITFTIAGNEYNTTVTDSIATLTLITNESCYNQPITAGIDASDRYNQATSNVIQLDKGDTILTFTQEETGNEVLVMATITDINNNSIENGSITFTNAEDVQTFALTDSKAYYTINKTTSNQTLTVTFHDNPAFNQKVDEAIIPARVVVTELRVDTLNFTLGETTQITASIYIDDSIATGISKGKVTFKVNGKTLKDSNGKVIYVKVVNGTATMDNFEIPDTWNNQTSIQAVYSGSTDCQSLKSDKQSITVTQPEVTLVFDDVTATVNETVTINIQVTQAQNPVNTGKIIVKVNGKTIKDTSGKVIFATVSNGIATIDYTIPQSMKAKNYTLTAIFTATGYERVEEDKILTIRE